MKLIFFITVVCLVLAGWYTYLRKGRGYSPSSARTVMWKSVQETCSFIKKKLEIKWMRNNFYQIMQDIRPFEKSVSELHICKYFKFFSCVDINTDISEIRFKLLGISNEYRENINDLAILLCNLFQDFYIERLGSLSYPLVYVTHIQEGELVFHVAKNMYGNQLITERANSDRFRDMPNMEELEDD